MAKEVRIRVRGVRRGEPDLRRLARALLRAAADEQRRQAATADEDKADVGPTEAVS